MADVNLADAKARFSELIAKAEAGETIRILKRGKPVAVLSAVEQEKVSVDLAELQRVTSSMTGNTGSAARLIRKMRDEDRY